MHRQEKEDLLFAIRGLMLSDTLGDVHDEIIRLCELADVEAPEGDFIHGWSDDDWAKLGGQ